ncbi:Fe(3+) ABC transporter substrate-binding protein [Acuticoccus sediminis]|uniref:Fe(3+) ABC transporter substrate-binding protein n=1 Tax=Acuticoccus sediminis TaxID=2184697 RepID=A0A8B2P2B0_9HYPH|nr:ABC transporter substrate-binding protein [Acuticoccus sediminis]RAI03262.1 Fe(3+) ABC transporter substrate-binding protein [Acuticoccus sediminis]
MRFALAVAATLVAGSALAEPSGTLTLYTSQPNADAQATVDAFQKAYPGVTVDFFRDGTTKVMAKLEGEFAAGQPQADVLLIADTVTMQALKEGGRLMAYPEADTAAYPDGLMDKEGFYFSTKLITTGIVYNKNAPLKPTSYADLLSDEAAGKIMIPSPLTSGAATITMETLTSDPALGWDFYEGLADQDTLASGGNGGVYKAVAGGEKLYGFLVDYLAIRSREEGAPIDFVFPTEGVSYVTEPVAILSTTDNAEAARAFVDFLLSEDGQTLAADQGYLPADPAVQAPAGFPARDEIKLMQFDPAAALKNSDADKMRFSELFGG